jgi:hypothetical protein
MATILAYDVLTGDPLEYPAPRPARARALRRRAAVGYAGRDPGLAHRAARARLRAAGGATSFADAAEELVGEPAALTAAGSAA